MFKRRRTHRVSSAPYWFIAPFFLSFLAFSVFPLIASGAVSFTSWDGINLPEYTGLRNFVNLFEDPLFYRSIQNILVYTLMYVPLLLGLALLLAILMESRYLIAKPFFRTVFFLPVVMSLASTTLAFWMLLHPDIGLVNLLLERVGLPTRDWLRIPELGIPVITAISLWRWTGLNTMIILAGMKGIPRALYEAAEIDGADGWARFWSITLPSLRPVLFFILVMAVIATLQAFDEPWLIAGHGYHPDYISTPVVYLYQQFGYHHLGISAAAGYVLAMGIFVATMLQIRFLGRVSGMTAEA